METTKQTTTPRAWIGCLACYNAGHLRGKWITAEEAAAEYDEGITTYGGQATQGVYPSGGLATRCNHCGGDEFDVFDYENVPAPCRTVVAFYESAAYLAEETEETLERLTVLADWLGGSMTLADLTDYDDDNYCGQWDTFREYAEQLADDMALLGECPEQLAHYFDWQAWADDLGMDYYHDRPTGHTWRAS